MYVYYVDFHYLAEQLKSGMVGRYDIIAEFRTCGVYPFNPSAICVSVCNTDYEGGTGSSVPTSVPSSPSDSPRKSTRQCRGNGVSAEQC